MSHRMSGKLIYRPDYIGSKQGLKCLLIFITNLNACPPRVKRIYFARWDDDNTTEIIQDGRGWVLQFTSGFSGAFFLRFLFFRWRVGFKEFEE